MPLLLQTASSTPGGKVRVINTSSMAHVGADYIAYDTLKDGPKRRKKGSMFLYSQSKFVSHILPIRLFLLTDDCRATLSFPTSSSGSMATRALSQSL